MRLAPAISCSGLCRGDRDGHPAASQQHIALAPHARPLTVTRSRGRLIVGSSLRFDCGRRAHRMSPARQRRACARRCSDGARREEGDKCRGSSRCKTFLQPLAAVSGCYCVHCFCCSSALPVSCACNCHDSTASGTVYACNLLPPVPCITHDIGRGAERGGIFFHDMCRGCRGTSYHFGNHDSAERCAVLMPIDESTLGFWLLRRSDPCCYCYRKI